MPRTFYTYILRCADDSYYTGVTNNIERRISEHNSNDYPKSYCHKRRPVKLVFLQMSFSIIDAIAFEKQIKKWTKAKKEALISQNYNSLKELSECKNDSHFKLFSND